MLLAESLLGSSSVEANYIEDVFSTYLYTGNSTTGGTQTITNGVDLSTKGGMVWIKGRSAASNNVLFDTARGAGTTASNNQALSSNLVNAEDLAASYDFLSAFNATGFTVTQGGTTTATRGANYNSVTYASWAFRKQPKFFDVVTYTGDGVAGRTVPHNLGSVPGCIIVKCLTPSGIAWQVYHRSLGNNQYLVLNTTAAAGTSAFRWNNTTPTASVFTLGSLVEVNGSGYPYVAYLFAHDAGGFGASGTDNVISCGSFTTDAFNTATINLSWEPQWVLVKNTGSADAWNLIDNTRGWVNRGANDSLNTCQLLIANSSSVEAGSGSGSTRLGRPLATGFSFFGDPSNNFIYIAIRRGPMKAPTTGTSVFGLSARTGTGANATVTGGQLADAILVKNRGSVVGSLIAARLTGSVTVDATATGYMVTSDTAAEAEAGSTILQALPWDVMDGVKVGTTSTITNASANTFINYLFRRAPGFFDVVCYTGTGANTTQTHNLGVVPELMIVKQRNSGRSWPVYSASLASNEYLILNDVNAKDVAATYFNSTRPTSSVFSVGTNVTTNSSGATYVAYLFATVAGVSKVFSYTGNGSSQTINCGFTGGARFVLIKRTDSTGNWTVFDSARGIVAGNDPALYLNSTAAEVTTIDAVDTDSSGFIVNQDATLNLNVNNATYIGLAIA